MKFMLESLRRFTLFALTIITVFISYAFAPTASASIYVGNLPPEINQNDVEELFSAYGTVKSVQLPTDSATGAVRGFAFVEFSTDDEEAKAVAYLDGVEFLGRNIKVSITRKPARKK